jgi:zinc/manganese transport system substrate-binding protein
LSLILLIGEFMKKLLFLIFIAWPLCSKPQVLAPAKLKIVTTLEVLKALTTEIGGDRVEVESLSKASEDPHFIKAKPTFKLLVSKADLFIEIGRSLELWAPQVIESAGNTKIMGEGLIKASVGVKSLEVPTELSRKNGDVHPEGNPHIWLSPTAALKMAENIKNALIKKDEAHKKTYEDNFIKFKEKLAIALFGKELSEPKKIDFLWRLHDGKKLDEYLKKHKKSVGGWLKLTKNIDYSFITWHTVWSYLADEFGLKIFAQIEEKSGIAPSLKYQNELIKKAKEAGVKHIVAASYYKGNSKLMDLIASKIDGKKLLIDVDCEEGESYISMMDRILDKLVKFKEKTKNPKPRG